MSSISRNHQSCFVTPTLIFQFSVLDFQISKFSILTFSFCFQVTICQWSWKEVRRWRINLSHIHIPQYVFFGGGASAPVQKYLLPLIPLLSTSLAQHSPNVTHHKWGQLRRGVRSSIYSDPCVCMVKSKRQPTTRAICYLHKLAIGNWDLSWSEFLLAVTHCMSAL